ncbi:hypothetical protein LTR84_001970 [Exophiala bonariae]|uniref:Transmembrane protein n=1 Tax=Exophiala bonariae TaxID=1690606 RepID=A0AAV9ND92_9EURO|nr:hypothetical protein LTR84_001970 [Exophiala bonariae]
MAILEEKSAQQSRLLRRQTTSTTTLATVVTTSSMESDDSEITSVDISTQSASVNVPTQTQTAVNVVTSSTTTTTTTTTSSTTTAETHATTTGAYITQVPTSSTTSGYITQVPTSSTTGGYITQVPTSSTTGGYITQVTASTTTVGYITQVVTSSTIAATTTGGYVVQSTTAATSQSTTDSSVFVVQSSTTAANKRTTTPIIMTASETGQATATSTAYVTQSSSATGRTTVSYLTSHESVTPTFTAIIADITQSATFSDASIHATSAEDVTMAVTLTGSSPVLVINTQTFTDSTGGLSTSIVSWTSYVDISVTTLVAGQSQSGSSVPLPSTPPDEQRSYEVELGLALTNTQYFEAMYLPVLVAVLLKLIWSMVFAATKLMEPFYLLSREGGASAKDALTADYLSSSLSLNGLKTMFSSHPVMLLASFVYLLTNVLPALATQSTTVRAIAWCASDTIPLRCNPMWYLNIPMARVLQAFLATIAGIITLLAILSARRESGVFSNPSSLATMASILSNDDLVYHLQCIPQGASRSLLQSHLNSHSYTLARYQTRSGCIRYGVARAAATGSTTRARKHGQQRYSAVSNPSRHMRSPTTSKSTFSNKFLLDTIFLMSILGLLAVLVAYYLTGGENPFNNFFNHHKESRLVLTLIAGVVDGHWKQLEREVRILTPFRRLYQGSASPTSTVLATQNGTPITSLLTALWRGNLFHALVALVATLSDVLIVTIAGVPYSSAQTWMDFVVCIYTSWAILSIMSITVIAIFRWRALNEKMMIPSEPATLIDVWLMLCNENNGLREDTRGFEMSDGKERDEMIKRSGRRYWGGWLTQPEGLQRWCVERE